MRHNQKPFSTERGKSRMQLLCMYATAAVVKTFFESEVWLALPCTAFHFVVSFYFFFKFVIFGIKTTF